MLTVIGMSLTQVFISHIITTTTLTEAEVVVEVAKVMQAQAVQEVDTEVLTAPVTVVQEALGEVILQEVLTDTVVMVGTVVHGKQQELTAVMVGVIVAHILGVALVGVVPEEHTVLQEHKDLKVHKVQQVHRATLL